MSSAVNLNDRDASVGQRAAVAAGVVVVFGLEPTVRMAELVRRDEGRERVAAGHGRIRPARSAARIAVADSKDLLVGGGYDLNGSMLQRMFRSLSSCSRNSPTWVTVWSETYEAARRDVSGFRVATELDAPGPALTCIHDQSN